jgi:hypothetical protein
MERYILNRLFQFTAQLLYNQLQYGAFKPNCERFTAIPSHLQSIQACHHHLPRIVITVVTGTAETDHRS